MNKIEAPLKKLFIVLLTVIMTNCTEMLDETAYSVLTPENYFDNAENANTALMGVYSSLITPHFYTDEIFEMVLLPSKYVNTRTAARSQYADYTFPATDVRISNAWKNLYITINRANSIIERVPGIDMNDSLKAEYISEAKFLRAFSYFNLVRLYGGVPLKVRETVNLEYIHMGRSTIEEVYDLIIDDLKYAKENLPSQRPSIERGRATKCAAMALLGKVYLTMAGYPLKQADKWEMARQELKTVIDNKSEFGVDLLPDFADIFDVRKEENNYEAIFAIQYANLDGNYRLGSALPFFAAPLQSLFATAYGQYLYGFTTEFRDLYEADDVRRDVTLVWSYEDRRNGNIITYGSGINSYKDPNGIALGKYQNGPPGTAAVNVTHSNDIIVLRFADVLLMYAEAENEVNGPGPDVIDAINQVRTRANASLLTGEETQNEIRELVYLERVKELSGELHEYFDIQRLERVEDHVTNSYHAQVAGVTFDPRQYLYPIPQYEIDINNAIGAEDQNPGY